MWGNESVPPTSLLHFVGNILGFPTEYISQTRKQNACLSLMILAAKEKDIMTI